MGIFILLYLLKMTLNNNNNNNNKVQEFMYRDTTNVEPEMYDYYLLTYSMEQGPS